jgi:hypothetical protein
MAQLPLLCRHIAGFIHKIPPMPCLAEGEFYLYPRRLNPAPDSTPC